jgi:hypothetical protein
MKQNLPPIGAIGLYEYGRPVFNCTERPIGMCRCDTNNFTEEEPIIAVGKDLSGTKITGTLNGHGLAEIHSIIGTGKKFKKVKAVIDTGAYYTCVHTSIIEELNAWKKALSKVSTIHGNIELPVYMMNYHLGDDNFTEQCFVSDIRGIFFDNVEMIIGTQFLMQYANFIYYGKQKRFELIFT